MHPETTPKWKLEEGEDTRNTMAPERDYLNQESKILFNAKFFPCAPTVGKGIMKSFHVTDNKETFPHTHGNECNFATSLYN